MFQFQPNKKYLLLLAVLFILLGVVLSLSVRSVRYTDIIPPRIVDIDPTEAYENILNNPEKYIVIDVRSGNEYRNAHASSSLNLPIHYMYDDTHGLPNELKVPLPKNTDQEIYLLCTGGRLAGVAYSYLEHYGYTNIKRIEGGIANWAQQGLPIITQSIFNSSEVDFNLEGELDRPYVGS